MYIKKELADYSKLDFELIRAIKKCKPAKCSGRKVPSLVIIHYIMMLAECIILN